MYNMMVFDEHDMEDGKPATKDPPPTHQVQSREIILIFKRMGRSFVMGMIVMAKVGPFYWTE